MTRRRDLLPDESGFVMVIVILMLLVALGLATAALSAGLDSSASTSRDARERRAQQAADAGIQAQLYQQTESDIGSVAYNFNGGPLSLSNFLDCTVPQLNAGIVIGIVSLQANAAGVCPSAVDTSKNPVAYTPALGNHTTYTSEMITGQVQLFGSAERELFPKIVSIGKETSNLPAGTGPVYSREEAILAPIAPLQTVEGMSSGSSSVTIKGLGIGVNLAGISIVTNIAAVVNGDVLSRGTINLPLAAVGANLTLQGGSVLSTFAGQTVSGGATVANVQQGVGSQVIQRPAVKVADAKPDCPTAGCPAGYNSTTRAYSQSGGNVTFQPGDYVFCSFSATAGSTLSTSGTGVVRIFIRDPSSPDCAGDSADPNRGNFNDPVGFNNSLVGAVNGLDPSGLQIYLASSGTVTVGNSASCSAFLLGVCVSAKVPIESMIIYAPTSNVTVNTTGCLLNTLGVSVCSAGIFEGAVIGNQTTVSATVITQDLDLGNFPLYAGVNAFRPVQYIQCDTSVTSLTGATSDLTGC